MVQDIISSSFPKLNGCLGRFSVFVSFCGGGVGPFLNHSYSNFKGQDGTLFFRSIPKKYGATPILYGKL